MQWANHNPGLLDTNVFVHAYTTDAHSEECLSFLAAVERGEVEARLEPLVVHELSYVLPRYLKQMSRDDLAAYLLMVLSWRGVRGDTEILVAAVERWRDTPGLAFVDAYLAAIANRDGCPVYTKNVAELAGHGVSVPATLPPTAAPR
jgi:predicted nucleic acid-binding protein